MNTLIIGGSGHLSGSLARAALGKGHTVSVVTRGNKAVLEGVIPFIADRRDHAALTAAVAEVLAEHPEHAPMLCHRI